MSTKGFKREPRNIEPEETPAFRDTDGFWGAFRAFSIPLRDYLYPLVSTESRPRRRAPRFSIRRAATVRRGNLPGSRARVVLEDFSASGFGISGEAGEVAKLLKGKKRGDRFNLTICLDDRDWILEVDLVRRTRLGNRRRAAFDVLSTRSMSEFIADLELFPESHPVFDRLANYWMRKGFRWTATALWVGFIMAFLMVPSCAIRLLR